MKTLSRKQRKIVNEVWNLKPYQRLTSGIKEWAERNYEKLK